jgi:hypothetical protein
MRFLGRKWQKKNDRADNGNRISRLSSPDFSDYAKPNGLLGLRLSCGGLVDRAKGPRRSDGVDSCRDAWRWSCRHPDCAPMDDADFARALENHTSGTTHQQTRTSEDAVFDRRNSSGDQSVPYP